MSHSHHMRELHTCSSTIGVLPRYQVWHYPTKSSRKYLNSIQKNHNS